MIYEKRIHQLKRKVLIPAPLNEVFDFFSRAENLNLITPKWLNFKILEPSPKEMKKGAYINYSLKLYGIRISWKTEITLWDPPQAFVDEQIQGPYPLWIHHHMFQEKNDNTIMEDIVKYSVPGGFIEPLIQTFFVQHRLKKIFDYREQMLLKIFDSRSNNG